MSSSSSEPKPEPEARDKDGYPMSARMKLKRVREGEDLFEDMDSGHRYKSIKRKDGTMLLPVFEKKFKWKTEEGFKAMLLFLACMGAKDEFQLWSTETNAQMTLDEWKKRKIGASSKPPIKHLACGEVVETTTVINISTGQRIGCSCFSHRSEKKRWKNRRPEIVQLGSERHFIVRTPNEVWIRDCTGSSWFPELQCTVCGEIVKTTKIYSLYNGQGIGCKCNNPSAESNLWKNRRPEVVQWGVERHFIVKTPDEVWLRDCTNDNFCPELQCTECGVEVNTTSIRNLHQGHGIGCKCKNKTEKKLSDWLAKHFPGVIVTFQYKLPDNATKLDFHLQFPCGFKVFVELDGPQHFWKDHNFFTEEACQRDLDKETWAVGTKRISVIRLLQDDVWKDRYGWDTYLRTRFEAARDAASNPRVYIPDNTPEYSSIDSAYVQLRPSITTSTAQGGPASSCSRKSE